MNCVVIEDLISTGKSCLAAVRTLRKAGVSVKGVAAVFTYGLKAAEQNFKRNKCALTTLCDYDVLLENALANGYIKDNAIGELMAWKKDPESWQPKN